MISWLTCIVASITLAKQSTDDIGVRQDRLKLMKDTSIKMEMGSGDAAADWSTISMANNIYGSVRQDLLLLQLICRTDLL